jgi:hypothetical protein
MVAFARGVVLADVDVSLGSNGPGEVVGAQDMINTIRKHNAVNLQMVFTMPPSPLMMRDNGNLTMSYHTSLRD